MTMTPERLAELDAAFAKQAGTPFGENWIHLNTAAKHHIFAAYPDLRAHIAAQAATIARLTGAAKRSLQGWENVVEIGIIPTQHIDTATRLADDMRAALTGAS